MLARDVPLDILESNDFNLQRAMSEDTIHSRNMLHDYKKLHQVLHPLDKTKLQSESQEMRDNIQTFLLRAVSFGDEMIEGRIQNMAAKKRFAYSLRFYRDNIQNPQTLQKKIYNLILDPNSEYKRVKEQQKIICERQKEQMKIQSQIGHYSGSRRSNMKHVLIGNAAERTPEKGANTSTMSHQKVDPYDPEKKTQVLSLARSKSEEFLKKLKLRRSTFYKKPSPDKVKNYPIEKEDFSIEQQGPNADMFLKTSLNQQNITLFKRNNYAVDLIRPNNNLPQYKRRLQDSQKKQIGSKSVADLSYLFTKQKNIFITENSKLKSKLNDDQKTFITTQSQFNNEPDTPKSMKDLNYNHFQSRLEEVQKQVQIAEQNLDQDDLPQPQKELFNTARQHNFISISLQEGGVNDYLQGHLSRNTDLTSMDSEKVIRLNMAADHETQDTEMIQRKKEQMSIYLKRRKHAMQQEVISEEAINGHKRFSIRPIPCFPKKEMDGYIQKFNVISQTHSYEPSPDKAKWLKQKQETQQYKEKIAYFLSESKRDLAQVKKTTREIIKKRDFLQRKIEGGLMNASQNIYTEFSADVYPSNEQMKMINREIKKMNSVNSDRVIFNIKPNRRIEEFKPLRRMSKLDADKFMYKEQFLSNIEKADEKSDSDEETRQQPVVGGIREFPSFYQIKNSLKLLYDQPNLILHPLIPEKQEESEEDTEEEVIQQSSFPQSQVTKKRQRRTIAGDTDSFPLTAALNSRQ